MGGAQGGANNRDRDACRIIARGKVCSVVDIAGEKVDVDDF